MQSESFESAIQSNPSSRYDSLEPGSGFPKPYVRLLASTILGIVGALLFPPRMEVFPEPFGNINSLPLSLWLVTAFAAILILQRIEGARLPRRNIIVVGTICLAAWICSFVGGSRAIATVFGIMNGSLLVLIIFGYSLSRLRVRGCASLRYIRTLTDAAAIVATAPLRLFLDLAEYSKSAHPYLRPLLTPVLGLVLISMFAGMEMLASFLTIPIDRILAFKIWAWIACSLIYLLWPRGNRAQTRSDANTSPPLKIFSGILLVALFTMVILIFGRDKSSLFFPSLTYWPVLWIPCALSLLIMTCEWISWPTVPRLRELPKRNKFGPLWTLLLAAIPLVVFQGDFNPGIIRHVLTGGTLGPDFHRVHVGSALDQPTIGKWYFWFTVLSAILLPYLAMVRWSSDRTSWCGHLAFALPAFATCLMFLCILTLPFDWLLEYINAMGWTVPRAMGLIYGMCGYYVILSFLLWVVWKPPLPSK